MPRISGVDIPSDKPIRIALRYIYGVGPSNSDKILKEAGIDGQRRAKELSEEELAKIIGLIDKAFLVEGALRRNIQQNIARLRDIGSYRGNRHRRSLPVRGQRTRSNARTRKGPPFAAGRAAEKAASEARKSGMMEIEVKVKGPGAGREQAVLQLQNAGLKVTGIEDVT